MGRDNAPYSHNQNPPGPSSNEAAAALLEVLRAVNKEVAVPELGQAAQHVVEFHGLVAAQLAPDSMPLNPDRLNSGLTFDKNVFASVSSSSSTSTPPKPGTSAA